MELHANVANALAWLRKDRDTPIRELPDAVPSALRLPMRATIHVLIVAGVLVVTHQRTMSLGGGAVTS